MPFLTGNTLAVSTKWIFSIRPPFQMYSLQQKHCTTALDEKSSVFLTVNFYEILHVSTYTIYEYISKVKKSPRMATLTYSHFGNPSRSYHHAHYRPFLPLTDGRGGHKYSMYIT